jgi:hypothetical protein
MKMRAFDELAQEFGSVSNRRGFLRLLGGSAAVAVVASTGLGEAEAKRKKKGKGKGKGKGQGQGQNQNSVCRAGEQIAQLAVPYSGVVIQTPVLAQGQRYTVTVSGAAATNGVHSVDAEYDFITATPADVTKTTDVAVGVDVGLAIDDATIDATKTPKWGPYNPAHVYSQQITGQGRSASLQMQDSIYTDNSGAVTVTITCG